MTSFQKVIKYVACALAIFLIVTIIGGIITGLTGISFLLSGKEKETPSEMQTYSIEGEITSLSVDLSGAELKIQTGDKFEVQSNHKYISVKTNNGKLTVSETKKFFAISPKGITVILTVPESFVFDEAEIDTGAGKVEIGSLSVDVLELSLGAGKADIKNLTANSRAEIDGGAGELSIDGGRLCNLKLDMGVGKLTLKSRIEGKSELDMGVGETNIILLGSKADYKIELDKGIGTAKLQSEEMADDAVYGSGESIIEIDGGVGAISIDFSEDGTVTEF